MSKWPSKSWMIGGGNEEVRREACWRKQQILAIKSTEKGPSPTLLSAIHRDCFQCSSVLKSKQASCALSLAARSSTVCSTSCCKPYSLNSISTLLLLALLPPLTHRDINQRAPHIQKLGLPSYVINLYAHPYPALQYMYFWGSVQKIK